MSSRQNDSLPRGGREHTSAVFTASTAPILTVELGEHFILETRSLLTDGGFEETTEYERFSIPVTGPVAILGVSAGDALCINVHAIEIAARGAMVTLPGRGGFTGGLDRFGYVVNINDGQVWFDDDISIPTRPMIGKLGVAPASGTPSSSTVGTFGGNMDCKDIVAGSSVILPVQVDQALLFAGDLHAVQGDGECSLTGVEVEGSVELSCTLLPGLTPPRPVVLSNHRVITVGDGESLDDAAKLALDDMLDLVCNDRGWSREKAAMLMSATADVAVSQLVNSRVSVKVSLPYRYFDSIPFHSQKVQS
jgi:amidase